MSTVVWPHRASPLAAAWDRGKTKEAVVQARKKFRVIMAGGGTGGHLYPGLAVAEALKKELGENLEIIWAATPRAVDQRLLGKFGASYMAQPVQPMARQVSRAWAFWNGWRRSCAYWKKDFATHGADAVLALGGYAAGPAAFVAGRVGIPVGLINPDALPGLANRFLLKSADRIFVQWELPAGLANKVRGRVSVAGCPIRESLMGLTRQEGAAALALDARRPVLVITGASLGAKTINEAMLELLKDPEILAALETGEGGGWQLLHLAGVEQAAGVKAAYEPIKTISVKVLDYCDDMASVWAVADAAIARAGASTCAELTACGVPAILLPYPFHKDMHQHANARHLVRAGAAVEVEDRKNPRENAAAMKPELLHLLLDRTYRKEMATAARSAGKPDAALAIAQEMMALMQA